MMLGFLVVGRAGLIASGSRNMLTHLQRSTSIATSFRYHNSKATISTATSIGRSSSPSTAAAAVSSSSTDPVYIGPLRDGVRKVKLFSLTSLAISSCGIPALAFLQSDARLGMKIAIIGSALAFSAATTAALHFVSKAYVTKMYPPWEDDHGNTLTIESFDFLARPIITKLDLYKLEMPAASSFASFRDPESGKSFFVHREMVEELCNAGKLPIALRTLLQR